MPSSWPSAVAAVSFNMENAKISKTWFSFRKPGFCADPVDCKVSHGIPG